MDIFEKLKKISSELGENANGKKPEYIICGLGNPGVQYEHTRHNTGFMAIEAMEKKYGFSVTLHKFKALVGNAVIGGKNCLVMKPETFMNNSGEAVSQAMDFYKIPLENVIVISDDISLDVAKMRIKRKGSAGGHNGLKSIIALCGGDDFPRIKVGIGAKPHPDFDLADWVLSRFSEEDLKKLNETYENTCSAVELIVQGKTSEAMNKFN